jgi:hypothetical protein
MASFLRSTPNQGRTTTRVGVLRCSLAGVTYAVVLGLALVGLLSERRRRHPVVLSLLLIVGGVAALHTFAEIQPRYHSYLVPLFCILAGQGVAVVRERALDGGRPRLKDRPHRLAMWASLQTGRNREYAIGQAH